MPVTSEISSDLLNALRSGGFAGELRIAVNPNTVVFQAAVNQTITNNSFISFAWDGVLEGAYTDVVPGMTFFITETDDPAELRAPLLRGRASQVPTSTLFYCNESAINLTDGMIVTVIANFEIVQKDRIANLVDGYQSFEDLAPLVKNMQSFYYVEDTVEGQFSFAPVGQAMAQGATITGYQWTIAGATYDVGSSTTQNITVTVPAGHTWAYLDVTDSNDTTFRFIFEILVCDRDDTEFMYMAHDNVTINGSVENGWTVSTTYFDGMTTLLNRSRAAIVCFDIPKTGAASLFNPVVFVGYFVQETTEVTADAASSLLSQTAFELQSFTAIAGQLPVPSLPVRNVAVPVTWGDMNLPTPQRAAAYLMTRYSTLANLCAIDMLVTDATWFAGEMDLEEGTLLDSVNRIGTEIQARLVFFPQGDATYEINANFLSTADRDALPTLIASGNVEPQDVYDYSLPIPYYKTVGQVIAGCATFYANGTTPVKLEAIAPATARQEGNEKPIILAQLLEADLTQADAITAAKQRVGDLLEYMNPVPTIPTTFLDGWRILTPSTRVWLMYDLPASDNTRGIDIPPTDRYWLQSVTLTWDINAGMWSVSGVSRLETRGGLAQQKATISPNVIVTDVPALPPLSDYDAFAPDGSLNYTSLDPDDIDRQPYDPFDMAPYTPMTTEDSANAADNTPGAACTLLNPPVNFKSSATRLTPNVTVNGETYIVTVKGRAQIGDTGTVVSLNFLNVSGEPEVSGDFGVPGFTSAWTSGEGWVGSDPTDEDRNFIEYTFDAPTYVEFVTFTWSEVNEDYDDANWWFGVDGSFGSPTAMTIGQREATAGVGATVSSVRLGFERSGADVRKVANIESLVINGGSGETLLGDAFYFGSDGGTWELYPTGRGLLLNGLPIGVPPVYNENSEYVFAYTGDGNQTPFTYYDTDYTDNQNLILYIKVCGPGMGS